MSPRSLAALATLLLALPGAAAAQTAQGDVTLQVPLNLTRVSPDIEKVAVFCRLTSAAITNGTDLRGTRISKQVELPVSGGQLNTTVSVVFSATVNNPAGQAADYSCQLSGYSKSLQLWDVFSDSQARPAFKLTPTPAQLTGNFTW